MILGDLIKIRRNMTGNLERSDACINQQLLRELGVVSSDAVDKNDMAMHLHYVCVVQTGYTANARVCPYPAVVVTF